MRTTDPLLVDPRDRLMRLLTVNPTVAFSAFVALQVVIAVIFDQGFPERPPGFASPLLLLAALAGALVVGVRLGLVLGALAALLAFWPLELSPYLALLWVPLAAGAGYVGRRTLESEMQRRILSAELQAGLVPSPGEDPPGATVVHRYQPGERRLLVGGDFYEVIACEDGRVALAVGDVSGHGAVAAAAGVHLVASWRALALAGEPVDRQAAVMNEVIEHERRRAGDELFATACFALVDLPAGTLDLVRAGHYPPVLVTSTGAVDVPGEAHPVLGGIDGYEYTADHITLPPAPWSLVFYTDGLIEGRARPGAGERYGAERALAYLGRGVIPPVGDAAVDGLLADARRAHGGPLPDDVVVIALSPEARPRDAAEQLAPAAEPAPAQRS